MAKLKTDWVAPGWWRIINEETGRYAGLRSHDYGITGWGVYFRDKYHLPCFGTKLGEEVYFAEQADALAFIDQQLLRQTKSEILAKWATEHGISVVPLDLAEVVDLSGLFFSE